VRSKWLTLAVVGSLGLMGTLWWASGGASFAADDDRAPQIGDTDQRRQALELLRRANAELQANRFDEARQLAKQADGLQATYSLFDVRPEHVLAEIERRERSSGFLGAPSSAQHTESPSPTPAAQPAERQVQAPKTAMASDPNFTLTDPFSHPKSWLPSAEAPTSNSSATDNEPSAATQSVPVPQAAEPPARPLVPARVTPEQRLKARAVTMLDQGLQALDEHRLGDAERYARAALALHAPFGKLEYKPEYLLTEVGIARARQRLETETTPATKSQVARSQVSPSAISQSPMSPSSPWPTSSGGSPAQMFRNQMSPNTASSTALPQSSAAAAQSAAPLSRATTAAPTAATPSVPTAQVSELADRHRAEQMLQEAVDDLHAGRDDLARLRIQGALRVMHPNAPSPLPLLSVGSTIGAEPTAGGPLPPQPGMPRAGFPSYIPNPVADDRDAVLKPLHDPYFGDEPTSTKKSTAAENSLREMLPDEVPLHPALSLDRPLPMMSTEVANPPVAASNPPSAATSRSAAGPGGVTQTVGSTQTQAAAAKAHWPESDPAPASQSTAAPSTGAYTPAAYSSTGASQAPAAASANSTARYPYTPPTTDPVTPPSPDAEHPGYFRRLWSALTGD
jgi:hypothetical protein